MNKKVLTVSLALLCSMGMSLHAIEPYIPNQFFGLQDSFYSLNSDARPAYDFYNPAQLVNQTGIRARFSSAPDFWGYSQWLIGGSMPLGKTVVGMTYLVDEAGDLISTNLDENGRPEAAYGFADRQSRAQIAIGTPLSPDLALGLRIAAAQATLDTARTNRLWGDVGVLYRITPQWELGAYTDMWMQVYAAGGNGSIALTNNAVSRFYVESGYRQDTWFGGISTNLDVTRLSIDYQFPAIISLNAMTLLRLKSSPLLRGYQLGTRIRLEQLQVDYRFITLLQGGVSETQHLVGLSYLF